MDVDGRDSQLDVKQMKLLPLVWTPERSRQREAFAARVQAPIRYAIGTPNLKRGKADRPRRLSFMDKSTSELKCDGGLAGLGSGLEAVRRHGLTDRNG